MKSWLLLMMLVAPLRAQHTMAWTYDPVARMRYLYELMHVEFAGCVYGRSERDTLFVELFVGGRADPRQVTDSSTPQGNCPNFTTTNGLKFVGIAHSHVRKFAACAPSAQDRNTLALWLKSTPVQFGVIMCAEGDSLVVFDSAGFGVIGVPPLDSLFPKSTGGHP